jgi:mannose-6-phosphate isomerase-like protein (cupin superfamily)
MDDSAPLADRYFYLSGTAARPIDVPVPEFWQQLIGGNPTSPVVADVATGDGWLISTYDMAEDMSHSEMHPIGDELHYLVSGRLDLVLEEDDGDTTVELVPGDSAVVAQGVWHRFVVHERGVGVAITCGRGTEHRPLRTR